MCSLQIALNFAIADGKGSGTIYFTYKKELIK